MKKTIIVFSFVIVGYLMVSPANALVLRAQDKVPNSLRRLKNIVSKIKKKSLVDNLRELTIVGRENRLVGGEGHKKTREWIVKKLKEMDINEKASVVVDTFDPDIEKAVELYENDFKSQIEGKFDEKSQEYKQARKFTDQVVKQVRKFKSIQGKNIIWEKKGSIDPDSLIIISANYDTIIQDAQTKMLSLEGKMPGADDNGSGVVILLALAELLLEIETPKSIQLVFYDYQEFSSLGSRAYLKKYGNELKKNKKFVGMVNLLMLGNDTKSKDKQKAYGNMNAYIRRPEQPGYGLDLSLANSLLKRGKKTSSGVTFELKKTGFEYSDNLPFWEAGLPSIVFTQNWEDDFNTSHHTSNDFVETLNFNTLWASYRYLAGSVVGWSLDLVK